MFKNFRRGLRYGLVLLLFASTYAPGAVAQIIINELSGGGDPTSWTISETWTPHEFDIIFPSEYRGSQISDPIVYYRLYSDNPVTVNGGFTSGDDGPFIVTPQNFSTVVNTTPPGTTETDNYLVFDFSGQTLDIPANGIVWFRFDWVSGGNNHNENIGGTNTYTTTYQQQNITRENYTSFAVYGGGGVFAPVPALSHWALITLVLLLGLFGLRRRITRA